MKGDAEHGHGDDLSGAQPDRVLLSSGADPDLTEIMHYDNDSYSNFSSSTWHVERYHESYQQLVCYPISGNYRYECRYQDGSSWYGGWSRSLQYNSDAELISPSDAFSQLEQGSFTVLSPLGVEISDALEAIGRGRLTIAAVELRYLLDSKGFYQPVYVFSGTWQAPDKRSNPLELMVPALNRLDPTEAI